MVLIVAFLFYTLPDLQLYATLDRHYVAVTLSCALILVVRVDDVGAITQLFLRSGAGELCDRGRFINVHVWHSHASYLIFAQIKETFCQRQQCEKGPFVWSV